MKKERIRLLDILRGFAIAGTLGTNIWIFAHLGDLSYITTYEYSSWWSLEDFWRMFILFLVNGKLLGLLTIMFGVGLELKYRQSLRKNQPWPGLYIWTSCILIMEGFIHFLFVMEYDILMSYGITAIIVSLIIKGGDRIISRTMKVIGGIHAVFVLFLLLVGILGANMSLGSFYDVTLLYKAGTWLEQVNYRLDHFLLLRSEAILVIPMNIFLFLLGVRFMRSGVFSPNESGKRKRKKLFNIGIYVGVPLNLLVFIPGGAFDLPVRYLFAPILSLGYLALIARMVERNERLWIWRRLEQMGKMSLSCYVMQNLIASFIFYGWGLGLGGKVNSPTVILLWILICCCLMIISSFWLKYFTLGPMESMRKHATGVMQR